jgi:hypothetical protein
MAAALLENNGRSQWLISNLSWLIALTGYLMRTCGRVQFLSLCKMMVPLHLSLVLLTNVKSQIAIKKAGNIGAL